MSQHIRQLGKDLRPERKRKEGDKGGARRMERQREEETEKSDRGEKRVGTGRE